MVSLLKHAVTWIGVSIAAFFVYLSIDSVAGKSTDFKSIIDWGVRVNASEVVAWTIAAVLGGANYHQSRARRQNTRNLAPGVQAAEKSHDPGRTSSGLSPDGEYGKEGEI